MYVEVVGEVVVVAVAVAVVVVVVAVGLSFDVRPAFSKAGFSKRCLNSNKE